MTAAASEGKQLALSLLFLLMLHVHVESYDVATGSFGKTNILLYKFFPKYALSIWSKVELYLYNIKSIKCFNIILGNQYIA